MTFPLNMIQQIPHNHREDLITISSILQSNGYECYLVGGAVRDLVMGKEPHEYDLTTSAHPEQIKSLFKKVIDTGIKHGTVTILQRNSSYEITTFRQDIGYTDGRRPDSIVFGTSLIEDLKRRDFTMNALALDVISGRFIDEHNGLQDIKNKIIRTIGNPIERFQEDGLRAIRAIRFSACLSFSIEESTYKAIYQTRNITAKVSTERFHDELNKILLSENPSIGIIELCKNQIFELFTTNLKSPDIEELKKLDCLIKYPVGLRLIYTLKEVIKDTPDKYITISNALKDLKYSRKNTRDALFFYELFNFNLELLPPIISVRRLLSFILDFSDRTSFQEYLEAYISYLKLIKDHSEILLIQNNIKDILKNSDPLTLKELEINGSNILSEFPDLEKKSIGLLLKDCLEYVFSNPEKNSKQELLEFLRIKIGKPV